MRWKLSGAAGAAQQYYQTSEQHVSLTSQNLVGKEVKVSMHNFNFADIYALHVKQQ